MISRGSKLEQLIARQVSNRGSFPFRCPCYSLQVGFVFALGSLLIADFETFVRHLIFSTSAPLFRSETEDEGDQRPKTLPSLPMKACLIFVWMPFFFAQIGDTKRRP